MLAALGRVAVNVRTVPIAGIARNGSDSAAPMMAMLGVVLCVGRDMGCRSVRQAHDVHQRASAFFPCQDRSCYLRSVAVITHSSQLTCDVRHAAVLCHLKLSL